MMFSESVTSRLVNWKFESAERLMRTEREQEPGKYEGDEWDTVTALAQTLGNSGWFSGSLSDVVRAAVAWLIQQPLNAPDDDSSGSEVVTDLLAADVARRVARECLVIGVPDIEHWPVNASSNCCCRAGNSGIVCGALTYRDYGSGELFTATCEAELSGHTLAELRQSIIRHLCSTSHVRDPYVSGGTFMLSSTPRDTFRQSEPDQPGSVSAPPAASF
jgi:hypothetical protein